MGALFLALYAVLIVPAVVIVCAITFDIVEDIFR